MNLSKPYERSHPKKYDSLIEKREKYILLDVKKDKQDDKTTLSLI